MITILLATFNGARTLPTMLNALQSLKDPGEPWTILVVDNGSTDNTQDILSEYALYLPIRKLSEPVRGKNRALNRALASLDGDLIILTDDDVVPDKNWLVNFRKISHDYPDYDIFGGHINIRWPFKPPDWVLSEVPLGPTFASTINLHEGPCRPIEVWGPNMCIRSSVFDRSGLTFNEHVGPAAGNYVMGSETDFVVRAAENGHLCWHTKHPSVQHIVRPEQLEMQWLLHRAYRAGRNFGRDQKREQFKRKTTTLLGLPRWRIRLLLESELKALWFKMAFDTRRYFRHKQAMYYNRGLLYELSDTPMRRLLQKPLNHIVR